MHEDLEKNKELSEIERKLAVKEMEITNLVREYNAIIEELKKAKV